MASKEALETAARIRKALGKEEKTLGLINRSMAVRVRGTETGIKAQFAGVRHE